MKETLKNCFTGFVAIAALLTLIVACHKDPTPSPTPTPTPGPDSTTIVEPPIDTVTYPDTIWFTMRYLSDYPNIDSVKFYAQKNSVKKIIMNLLPHNTTGWAPVHFNICHDTLQKRIDVAPQKVRGAGTIYVELFHGAQLPDPTETNLPGMAAVDSAWYVQNGWQIQRDYPFNKKSR